jgi:hypothetical protein
MIPDTYSGDSGHSARSIYQAEEIKEIEGPVSDDDMP